MKSLKINGKTFKVRQIRPIDYISYKDGPPMLFVSTKSKPKTMYEQVLDSDSNDKEFEQWSNLLKMVLSVGVISVNNKPFDVELYTEDEKELNTCIELFSVIIEKSFTFRKPFEIDDDLSLLLDTAAKRYGKTPSEILCSDDCTDFDRWVIDVSVCVNGLQNEADQAEKVRKEIKRNSRK